MGGAEFALRGQDVADEQAEAELAEIAATLAEFDAEDEARRRGGK